MSDGYKRHGISFPDPELLLRAQAEAKRQRRSLSNYIRGLLETDLEKHAGEPMNEKPPAYGGAGRISSAGVVGAISGAVGNVDKDLEAGRAGASPAAQKPEKPVDAQPKSKSRPGGPGRAPKKSP